MSRLGFGAMLVAGLVGCESYTPPQVDPDYSFHAGFVLGTVHERFTCESCHVVAADVMLGMEPEDPRTGWVTRLELDPNPERHCASCHPFLRNGPESPEATVDCASLPAGDNLRRSERCRYELSDAHRGGNLNCSSYGCHSVDNPYGWIPNKHEQSPLSQTFPLEDGHAGLTCEACHEDGAEEQGLVPPVWSGLGTACEGCHEDSRPSNHYGSAPCGGCHSPSDGSWFPVSTSQLSHDHPPLSDIFPLEGGHAGVACSSCHPGSASAEHGKSAACASSGCHSRAAFPPMGAGDVNHYPSPTTVEKDRDCMACHVVADTEVQTPFERFRFVWPSSWSDRAAVHGARDAQDDVGFRIGHSPTHGVMACEVCHDGFYYDVNYFQFSEQVVRSNCLPCHGSLDVSQAGEHAPSSNTACHSCHQTGVITIDYP